MIRLGKYVSTYGAVARRDHAWLGWGHPNQMLEQVRPVVWTCVCRATDYGRCEGGGWAFVQRNVELDGRSRMPEIRRWLSTETRVIWMALLSGRTR